jgi:ribosomal protein S21
MEKIGDFTKATKASDNFDSALKKIGKEITRIGQLSDKELKKLFPPEIAERVDKTSSAISTYNTMMKNSEKSKGAIG